MGLPRTRREAYEAGSRHYFTGKPCKHGHIDKRFTKTGACVECARDAVIKYRSEPKHKGSKETFGSEMPPLSLLYQLFEPDFVTGRLKHKRRTAEYYGCQKSADIFNSRNAGSYVEHSGGLSRYVSTRIKYNGEYKKYQLHRLLYYMYYGNIDHNLVVDHIDGNTSNNSINNLRQITRSENNTNCESYSSTGYRGVYKLTSSTKEGWDGRYYSYIKVNNKVHWIGIFEDIDEAVSAYDQYILDNNLISYRLNRLERDNEET